MTIDCPHGFKRTIHLSKNMVWEDLAVEVCAGICDCSDLCGKTHCQFYDLSSEATRKFCRFQGWEMCSLEGQQWVREQETKGTVPDVWPDLPFRDTVVDDELQTGEFLTKKGKGKIKVGVAPEEFDASFDELVENGFLKQVGIDEKGEPQYRLTKKSEQYADRLAFKKFLENNTPEKLQERMARRS